jgi:hypothetical protein
MESDKSKINKTERQEEIIIEDDKPENNQEKKDNKSEVESKENNKVEKDTKINLDNIINRGILNNQDYLKKESEIKPIEFDNVDPITIVNKRSEEINRIKNIPNFVPYVDYSRLPNVEIKEEKITSENSTYIKKNKER